jgi:23S rRNA (guanine745-N1)-methyltransferase
VVTPSSRHLGELVARLGLVTVDERKPERLQNALAADFALSEQARYEEVLRLSPGETQALAAMGPSARHLSAEQLTARAAALGPVIEATLSVLAETYTPKRP